MIKITKKYLSFLTVVICLLLASTVQAQNVKLEPKMAGADTANTDYLKGEARRLRENCQSLKTKAQELITLYEGYVTRTKECPDAKQEAKLALDMAKKAYKTGEEGMKLADKAEKASKMNDTKKYLAEIEAKVKSGHEYLKDSEERKKEIEFEMKGC
jgi:hypothetical protein